jgi:hypothetical protein
MTEYIDKTKLIADGWFLHRTYQQDAHTMMYESKNIADIPSADVAPVVHGRWMTKEYEYGDPEAGIGDMWVDRPAEPSDDYAFCPVCGNDAGYTGEGCLILSDYCPNCGARMDGDA